MTTAFIAPLAPDAAARGLLQACGLPHEDLEQEVRLQGLQLYGYTIGDTLAGMVGLEVCGDAALLRSLAVAPDFRKLWLGIALMAHAERQADAQDVREIWLLTTTAPGFFEKLGYRRADRAEAPEAIRATSQFRGACPATATACVKRIGA